jgi:hypothetical protein
MSDIDIFHGNAVRQLAKSSTINAEDLKFCSDIWSQIQKGNHDLTVRQEWRVKKVVGDNIASLDFNELQKPLPEKIENPYRNDWNVPVIKEGKLVRTVNERSDKSIAVKINNKVYNLPTSKIMWSGGNKALCDVNVVIPKAIWDKQDKK